MSTTIDSKIMSDAIAAGVAAALQKIDDETTASTSVVDAAKVQQDVLTGVVVAPPVTPPVASVEVVKATEPVVVAPTVATVVVEDVKTDAATIVTKVEQVVDNVESDIKVDYNKIKDVVKADVTATVNDIKQAAAYVASKVGIDSGTTTSTGAASTIETEVEAAAEETYNGVVNEEIKVTGTTETVVEVKAENLRMAQWLMFSVICYAIAWFFADHEWLPSVQVIFQKLGHINLGAFIGYWIDRTAFQDRITIESSETQKIRRATIIGVAMLALGLGI